MPTRLDDALIHQNYGTLEQVVDTDPRWFDRFYFDLQAIDGSLSIAQGIGVYPNMGVMDGFSLFCLPDKQVNVRASRELVNGNRDEMDVGPIHAEILVPMKSWRFWLEENAQGATYDFTYTSDFKALDPLRLISDFEGRRVWDWTHFGHVGRVEGWAKLDGKTYELKPDTHYAIRDRSWGVRPGVAVIEDTTAWFRQANWGTRYNWCCVQLESFYLWYFLAHETDGTPRYFEGLIRWADSHGGHQEKVVKLDRKLDFAEGEHFLNAAVDVHLLSGKVLHVNMKRLDTSIRLRGGNYGGYKGLIHGMKQGPLAIDGERWEPADNRVLPVTAGITEHVVEVTCGDERGCGIFEIPYGS
jgi:hypothetical protein